MSFLCLKCLIITTNTSPLPSFHSFAYLSLLPLGKSLTLKRLSADRQLTMREREKHFSSHHWWENIYVENNFSSIEEINKGKVTFYYIWEIIINAKRKAKNKKKKLRNNEKRIIKKTNKNIIRPKKCKKKLIKTTFLIIWQNKILAQLFQLFHFTKFMSFPRLIISSFPHCLTDHRADCIKLFQATQLVRLRNAQRVDFRFFCSSQKTWNENALKLSWTLMKICIKKSINL